MVARLILATKRGRGLRTATALGYSVDEFRAHIEALFEPWMSWSNHGEWHVDHVVPVSWFVRRGISDSLTINALKNLRPLAALENLSKHDQLLVQPLDIYPELAHYRPYHRPLTAYDLSLSDREWLAQQFESLTTSLPEAAA